SFKALYRQLRQSGATELDDEVWKTVLGKASDETRSREQPVDPTVADPPHEPHSGPRGEGDFLDIAPAGGRQTESYVRRVVAIVRQVTAATQALHEKGVIHRDIKPENILLTRDGSRAVLMDLGIAKLTKGGEGRLTRTREFVGSLRYASPEQVL